MKEATGVVISNYNGVQKRVLPRCLQTLGESLDYASGRDHEFHVILVDDGSKDDSLGHLSKFANSRSESVKILKTRDLDASGTLNRGIAYLIKRWSNSRFVVTLDHDVALSPTFLCNIVDGASTRKRRFGMFASNQYLLRDYPKRTLHRSTGHYVNAAGATWDRDFMKKTRSHRCRIVSPCLSGSLLRVEMLKEIGPIPKQYLHYYNCPELGFRAALKGWRVAFLDSAIMWHNYRDQHLIPEKQLESREKARIWNILRFFPRERISHALDTYLTEKFSTSPPPATKCSFIKTAKRQIPQPNQFSERTKRSLYAKFVEQRR